VYGTSSFGMTLHFHYCCGKLKKIDLTPPEYKKCGSAKHHDMGGKPCCDSKQVSIKIKSDQNPSKGLQASFISVAVKPVQPDFFVSNPVENKKLLPEVFAPPPLEKDFNHLFCIYRI
jgi:hypothetical protein